jgi:hypothetical protein
VRGGDRESVACRMDAQAILTSLLIVLLWSAGSGANRLPSGSSTSRAYAPYALADAQDARDQIPAEWRSLPKVPIGVNGSGNPEQIPDSLAYRHFIRATASSASAADIRRRELFLTKAGLTVADRLGFVTALGDVAAHLRNTQQQRQAAGSTLPVSEVDRLRENDERTFRDAEARVRAALSADGAARLDAYIRDHFKRQIVIYSSPPARGLAPCAWSEVSLLVEGLYSDDEGTWTVYAQTDAGAADHSYRIEVVASTKVSTVRTVTDSGSAEITRVYDEPGPVDYKAGLWMRCPGTSAVMAFGDTGTSTSDRGKPVVIDVDSLASVVQAIPHATRLGQAGAGSLLVTFGTRPEVVLREPVLIQLTIENRSAEGLEFDLGYNRKGNLQFQIMRPDGLVTELPRLRPSGIGGISRVGRIALRPLGVYTGQLLLDEWTTLDQPGLYDIRLTIDSTFRTTSGELLKGPVERSLRLRVGPRDEERLRQICDRLAQIAVDGFTAEARVDAEQSIRRSGCGA